MFSLIEHGRIKTTVQKAKELRRHVERAVTLGKRGGLHARRLLLSRYANSRFIDQLLTQWVPKFTDRPGGYTRIIKLGRRLGDNSEMAFIEFLGVDKIKERKAKKSKKGDEAKGDSHKSDEEESKKAKGNESGEQKAKSKKVKDKKKAKKAKKKTSK